MMLIDNVENRVKTIEIPILKVDSAELSINAKKVDLAVVIVYEMTLHVMYDSYITVMLGNNFLFCL